MSGDGWEELLAEAQERLREQEEAAPGEALGDEMTPAPEQHFTGRWRGTGTMVGTGRAVYLVWDRNGKPGFLYQHAKLVQEVEAEQPQVGDEVLVLRGPTREYEKDGEQRQSFPYVLRRRECSDPLAGEQAELAPPPVAEPADDDIPFMPTV